eukprot:3993718-Amphidinium_carterae.1
MDDEGGASPVIAYHNPSVAACHSRKGAESFPQALQVIYRANRVSVGAKSQKKTVDTMEMNRQRASGQRSPNWLSLSLL